MSSINFEPVRTVTVREILSPQQNWLSEAADRAAGLFLLLLTGPVMLTVALALAALSRRSPLVAHLRIGKNGRPFRMLKLRTMWSRRDSMPRRPGWIEHIAADAGGRAKDPADPRVVSAFAAFCRRHSIDELPQLWHVFRGEMSLVGPRPLTRPELVRHYGSRAAELLSVKPGLTGLWQVSGRSTIDFPRRSTMDLEMVRSLTPRMYLTILLRTFGALVSGKGAW